MNNDLIHINTLPPFKNLCMTIGELPSSYLESMTYYETLVWLCNYLEQTVIPTVNTTGDAVEELQGLYIELKNYVDNYFNNLDVQVEINHKLDQMTLDGTLENLIGAYIQPAIQQINEDLSEAIGTQNTNIENFETAVSTTLTTMNNKLDNITSGAPAGVYSTVSALETADPDHDKIYVVSADGKWYYYDSTNETWTAGGNYQDTVDSDSVDYLLNKDSTRNAVDFEMLNDIINLSKYTRLAKSNLANLKNVELNGNKVEITGPSEIKASGVSTADSIMRCSDIINIVSGQTYTIMITDLSVSPNDNMLTTLYVEGTTSPYKVNNVSQTLQINQTSNKFKLTFTADHDAEVRFGCYRGNGKSSTFQFKAFVFNGTVDYSDVMITSVLQEVVNGYAFQGTISSSAVIPTPKTKTWYLAQGPGPFTNFGSNTTYYPSDYLIIRTNPNNINEWIIQRIPLLTDNSVQRTSLLHLTTTSNPNISMGKFIWGIADTAGTYTNLLDYNGDPIVISDGEVAILSIEYDRSNMRYWWMKDSTNLINKAYVDNEIETTLSDNIETYVYTWLLAHPEATTTVQDGSISTQKLDTNLQNKANRLRLDSHSSTTWQPNNNDLNTIVGDNNMPNGVGSRNTIIGIDNLQANSDVHSANYEVAIGYHSLFRDWNGDHNVSIGNEAMDNLSHGSYNTALGSNALRVQKVSNYGGDNVEGETLSYNTSVGGSAMYYTYGNNNTAIGYEALKGLTYGATGSGNVALGKCAGKYNDTESNHLYIDNRDRSNRTNEINKSLIYGTFADDISNQEVKINGKFACNGKTPQAPVTASANATDLSTAITLLNQIKQVLINTGLMK